MLVQPTRGVSADEPDRAGPRAYRGVTGGGQGWCAMERLFSSMTRMVEAAVVASMFDAAVRTLDHLDPVGAEARDALTDEGLADFVGSGPRSS